MEPLIMMLIIMAISALFSKNKKPDQSQQAKRQQVPRTQKPAQQQATTSSQRSFKRIEDYAKEIYSEMQAQVEDNPKRAQQAREVKEQAQRVKTRATEEMAKRAQAPRQATRPAPAAEPKSRPGRLSIYQDEPLKREEKVLDDHNLLPLTEEDLRKGIIMAEILLPPKAKR